MTLPTDARQCTCGFDFDQGNVNEAPSSGEIRLDAEELYATYLTARAQQAEAAVKEAQRDFARDPANERKSALVAQAIEEARAAKEALAVQLTQIAQLKKSQVSVLPSAAPIQAPMHAASAPVPIASHKKIKNQTMVAKKQAMANVSSLQAHAKKNAVTAPVTSPLNSKRSINVTATAVAAKKSQATPTRKKTVTVTLSAPKPAPVPAQPVQTAQPNEVFRQAQAAKAEKIVRESSKPAAPVIAPAPAPTPVPVKKERVSKPAVSETKIAASDTTAKTAPRLYTPADKKECPNCTSSVAMNVARCRCGYEFPTSELLPALSMSEEERSEFAKLFSNL